MLLLVLCTAMVATYLVVLHHSCVDGCLVATRWYSPLHKPPTPTLLTSMASASISRRSSSVLAHLMRLRISHFVYCVACNVTSFPGLGHSMCPAEVRALHAFLSKQLPAKTVQKVAAGSGAGDDESKKE